MSIIALQIDSREPAWVQALKFNDVPKIVTHLPAGDLWIATDDNQILVIERKTPNDFLGSLKDGRIFAQVAQLKEFSPWAYVLISGEFNRTGDGKTITDRITGWNWDAVQGALLTIQEQGVYVMYCANDFDLESAVIRLANRSRDVVKVPAVRDTLVLSEGENIIASLPGIGMDRLDAVLKECGSVIWSLVALTDDELKIKINGIGEATKRRIRKALGMDDWMKLQIVEREDKSNEQYNDSKAA